MSKKVLILTSSARKNSNSELLAESFANGAKANGNEVETIRLFDKALGFCRGCLVCQTTQRCVINDDAVKIAEKMETADVLVFATPVYYYSISGQLKTMFDRANPLYTTDYAFRDVYLLASAAENDESAVAGSIKAVQGWVDCFDKANFSGVIFAGGVTNVGDIKDKKALQKAFETGKSL